MFSRELDRQQGGTDSLRGLANLADSRKRCRRYPREGGASKAGAVNNKIGTRTSKNAPKLGLAASLATPVASDAAKSVPENYRLTYH